MIKLFIIVVLLSASSCATYRANQTRALLANPQGLPDAVVLTAVPFIKQKENYCGPAALGMILNNLNYQISMEELATQMYTPKQNGSLPTDVISATRRHGFLAIPIQGFKNIFLEVANHNPVLVFQNLGIKQLTAWHYSVVVGFDRKKEKVILHTGKDKFKPTDLKEFERTWDLAGQWAIVVLPPGKLAITADEIDHLSAAASLEQLGKKTEAELSYKAILNRWSDSLGALIGMGNVTFDRQEFHAALNYLTKATQLYPDSAIAWHNLAITQFALNQKNAAQASSQKALALVSPSQKDLFQENLKEILN